MAKKEIKINLSDGDDSKGRIVAITVRCQVCDDDVTVVDETGEQPKVIYPYAVKGTGIHCQRRPAYSFYEPCGIYEGMRRS